VLEKEMDEKKKTPAKAVLFVQNTVNSELAHEIRKVVQTLKPWTGLNIKVVERAGDRLEDILHKSNPWEDIDCLRDACITCKTSVSSEKLPLKNCKKTLWCEICEKPPEENKDTEKNDDTENDAIIVKDRKRDREVEVKTGKYYRYIGETARSVYERGNEH